MLHVGRRMVNSKAESPSHHQTTIEQKHIAFTPDKRIVTLDTTALQRVWFVWLLETSSIGLLSRLASEYFGHMNIMLIIIELHDCIRVELIDHE